MSNGDTNSSTPVGSFGLKKSQFTAKTVPAGTATFDYVEGGTNYKITFSDLNLALGVTGTIVPTTESLTTPVLDQAGSVNTIRNLLGGSGIGLALTANNSIEISQDFTVDNTGAAVFNEATDPTTVRSIVAGDGISVGISGETIQITATGAAPVTGKTIEVNSMSDFPTPVGGVITLSDDTFYSINDDLSTADRFVFGDQTKIGSVGPLIVTMTYTGVATMFTSQDKTNAIAGISLVCASGTLLSWSDTGTPNTHSFSMQDVNVTCDTFGTWDSGSTLYIESNDIDCTTDGITIAGTNIDNVQVNTARIDMTAGTFIDLGVSTASSWHFDNMDVTLAGGATGISGAANDANVLAGGVGRLGDCSFFGAGTPVTGIVSSDALWFVTGCVPIQNTRTDALISMSGNATATTITTINTPVLVAGTFTEQLASRMTTTAAGRITHDPASPENLPIQARMLMYPVSGPSKTLAAYIAVNGTVVADTQARVDAVSSDVSSVSLTWQINFTQGDYIEVFVENQSDTTNILVEDIVIRVN